MTVHENVHRGEHLYMVKEKDDVDVQGCTIINLYKKKMNGRALWGAHLYIV